ncbi:DUF3269 family protein [Staphylococcus taiwanensis]|nr:DUF3269 family protein [Staphylococcus taiwanensis]
MGLIEGANNQYNLFTKDGDIAFTVYPLAPNSNCVVNQSGWRYTKESSFNLGDTELTNFKSKHNFYLEHELNMQMSIFDL